MPDTRTINAIDLQPAMTLVDRGGATSTVHGFFGPTGADGTVEVITDQGTVRMARDEPCQILRPDSYLPGELTARFHEGIAGASDVDVAEVVRAILNDVLDSVHVAVATVSTDAAADEVRATVADYIGNHYADL